MRSPQATADRETTQEAKALGIDPSSSASDVAAAASGPYKTGADGRIAGGDTGNESRFSPTAAERRAQSVLNIQAGKDGPRSASLPIPPTRRARGSPRRSRRR